MNAKTRIVALNCGHNRRLIIGSHEDAYALENGTAECRNRKPVQSCFGEHEGIVGWDATSANEPVEETELNDDFAARAQAALDLPVLPWTRQEDGTFTSPYPADGEQAMKDWHFARESVVDLQKELARRTADHKWRVKHEPAKADAYHASKVAPLEERLVKATVYMEERKAASDAIWDAVGEPERIFKKALVAAIQARFAQPGVRFEFGYEHVRIERIVEGDNAFEASAAVYLPTMRYEQSEPGTAFVYRLEWNNVYSWSSVHPAGFGTIHAYIEVMRLAEQIGQFIAKVYGI